MEVSGRLQYVLKPTPKSELDRRNRAADVDNCVRSKGQSEVPNELQDPISSDAFEKPVRMEGESTHQVFSVSELRKWDKVGNGLHPISRQPLKGGKLVDAEDVRQSMSSFYGDVAARLSDLGCASRAAKMQQKAATFQACTLTDEEVAPLIGGAKETPQGQRTATIELAHRTLAAWATQSAAATLMSAGMPNLSVESGLTVVGREGDRTASHLRQRLARFEALDPSDAGFAAQRDMVMRLSGLIQMHTDRVDSSAQYILDAMGLGSLPNEIGNLLAGMFQTL